MIILGKSAILEEHVIKMDIFMKKSLKYIIISSALTFSAYCNAQSSWVVGAQYGYGNSNLSDTTSLNIDKGGNMYGVTLGYDTDILRVFTIGLETGYFQGDLVSIDSDNVKDKIFPILLKGQINTLLGLNFFVKTGISRVVPASSPDYDWKSSWDYTLAGGMGYSFFDFNFFVQYLKIFGKGKLTGQGSEAYASNIQSITGGITYSF